jgi:hypothetical protein
VTVALHGNLQDFGIGEVFQLIGQQRKTGVLEVRGEQGEVELRFDSGGVVAAVPAAERPDAPLVEMIARCGVVPRDRLTELEREAEANEPLTPRILGAGLIDPDSLREIEDLLTRETIFDLLRWESGSFRFVAQPIAHDRPAEQLLGAEQVDGRSAHGGRVARLRRGASRGARRVPAPRQSRGVPPLAGRPRLADAGRSGTHLHARGRACERASRRRSLAPAPPACARSSSPRAAADRALRARRDPEPRERADSSERRRRLALIGPFALLLVLGGIAWWGRATPASEPLTLPADALGQARTRFEAARWRSLLLAHRLATGRWAGGLEEVAQWAGDAAPALTRSERDAYYLGQRSEGPVLLAPDRAPDRSPDL